MADRTSYTKLVEIPGKGRGIVANTNIVAGTIIEEAPVVVLSAKDRVLIDQTLLHDYIFEWHGEEPGGCCMALGNVPIYNHASPSNCEYEMDYAARIIRVLAMKNIAAGEELTINYNGDFDDDRPVWFPMS